MYMHVIRYIAIKVFLAWVTSGLMIRFMFLFFKISGSIMTLRFDSLLQDELEALPPCTIRGRRQGSGGAGGGTDHSEITLAKLHTVMYIHDVQYNTMQKRGYGRRNGCYELLK